MCCCNVSCQVSWRISSQEPWATTFSMCFSVTGDGFCRLRSRVCLCRCPTGSAALGAIVLYLALGLRCFGNFGRYGDMSYGIYIFHFPIVQTLVSFGVFRRDPWLALGIASGLVLLTAFLSWHLIERPFLRRSSHYVQATRAATGR